jgi:hypothetical protein
MRQLKIEVFEIKGSDETLPTDLEVLLIDAHKKADGMIAVRKINVLEPAAMKGHSDVAKLLKTNGMEVLPVIKIDGRLANQEKLEQVLQKALGA